MKVVNASISSEELYLSRFQLEAMEAHWTQREMEMIQEREESRKLAVLFQKVALLLQIVCFLQYSVQWLQASLRISNGIIMDINPHKVSINKVIG